MNILTEYPLWFLIFCLAAGFLFAFGLYFRERRSEFSATTKAVMLLLRFVSVSLIAFLLLSPLFKMQVQSEEKPKLLIFQDNSSSILNGPDSAYYQNEYQEQLQDLMKDLDDKYEPVLYYFSDEVSDKTQPDYKGTQTDIASVFDFIEDQYSNRNVGAVLLATDGVNNTGFDPVYAAGNLRHPLFTIAIGDTMVKPDVRINKVNFNEVVFLGNDFPVEVNVHADKSKGKTIRLLVRKNGSIVGNETLDITDDSFNKNIRFSLKAGAAGMQQYSIKLDTLDHELNRENNSTEFYVDVIDTRQKILLLYHSPHPDIAALRSVLEKNRQYELDVVSLQDFSGNLEQYNLLIFHQLPSSAISSVRLLEKAAGSDIPVLYIIGSQTDIGFFNNVSSGLQISGAIDFEDAYPELADNFGLFSISESLKSAISQWPPLQVYFGNYLSSNSVYVLLNQRIGSLLTDKPLMIFNAPAQEKSAVIAGEGIWRWRMTDYTLNRNQDNFDELIGKTVRYLSLQADKQQFRVTTASVYNEFDEIEFDARLYNKNFEPVNSPQVNLVVKDKDGVEYPFVMGKKKDAYYLNAGSFPVGVYRYRADVSWNSEELTDRGEFRVRDSRLEDLQLAANHKLLYRLAESHDGKMFYPGQFQELGSELKQSDAASVVSYRQEYTELLNLPWLLGVLIFLLGLEWFMRKWNGSY